MLDIAQYRADRIRTYIESGPGTLYMGVNRRYFRDDLTFMLHDFPSDPLLLYQTFKEIKLDKFFKLPPVKKICKSKYIDQNESFFTIVGFTNHIFSRDIVPLKITLCIRSESL